MPGTATNGQDAATQRRAVPPVQDSDYRLMVQSVADYAIFMLDPAGYVQSWNVGAQALKGYTADEILGRHFSVFYPQSQLDRGWPAHGLQQALEVGRFEDEGWRLRKDGTRFWANIVLTRLTGPDGTLRGFAKVTRDLTERRRQEEQLRMSEERFRLLVAGVKDYAIFMLDPDGRIVSWNAGAQANKGYDASEIIGRHFSVFYPEDVAASGWPARELELALERGSFEDEGWRIRKDGSRFWASVVITALHDEAGRHRGFAKVTRDLTDRRRIRDLEDEGRRMTTFLAMLGHELRNPLAPIANAVSVMQGEPLESEALRNSCDVIARQVKHISRLVDDLLDVSRITSGKIHLESKPVKLRDAIMDAIETVAPLVHSQAHSLKLEVVESDAWVQGDRARLVQIVTNLLSNAAKFTPPGGRLAVGLRTTGSSAEISVKDNGPGIPSQSLNDIFGLFVQGDQDAARSHGGLGLGLSLVHQLVTLHGGDVSVFSTGKAGEGSEFLVRLPLASRPAEAPRAAAPAAQTRQRVLVVDDNVDSADTMGMLLKMLGYQSEVVYDGLAAMDAVKAHKPDVVLLDLGLPGLGGMEVAQRLHTEFTNPPALIAVTGYGQDKDREASRKAGFFAHMTKPLQMEELSGLLKKLFG